MDAAFSAELHGAFVAACEDAEVDQRRVRIWFVEGDPFTPNIPPSVHYPPGYEIDDDDPVFDSEAHSAANSPEYFDIHRVGVQAGVDPADRVRVAAVVGLIRHEVEHARQYDGDFGAQLKRVDNLADIVADYLDDLDGGVSQYRSKPVELSANAAAARFLMERYPNERGQLEGTKFDPFSRSGSVLTPRLLAQRTVEWIRARHDEVDEADLFEDGLAWDERLDAEMPDASRWWE